MDTEQKTPRHIMPVNAELTKMCLHEYRYVKLVGVPVFGSIKLYCDYK